MLPDFQQAITAAADKLKESGSVDISQALGKLKSEITLKGIIEKLAGGLGDFIGYNGKGQGIALVIDPLQQLRKGVLMFLQMMLDRFRDSIDKDSGISTAVGNAIKNTEKFESAIKEVSKLEEKSDQSKNVVCALKNVTNLNDKNGVTKLAEAFKKYLEEVLGAVRKVSGINGQAQSQVDTLKSNLGHLLDKFGERSDFSTYKTQVNNTTKQLKSIGLGYPAQPLVEGVKMGTENFLGQLKTGGYTSSYQPTPNWDGDHDNGKIAKIFLGCLPLYYYWLTYLYWKCKQSYKNGGWEGQWLNSGSLSAFISGQGYAREYLKNQAGKQIATLLERFDELKDSMQHFTSVTDVTQPSHTDLLNELDNSLKRVIGSSSSTHSSSFNGHSLSALFYLCRCYFTGKQNINPVTERKPPTSIREMLYWLSGLQFSPHYSSIEKQIEHLIPGDGLHVADSSIPSTSKSSGDTLTQNQMKGFLLSSCLSAPGVLGTIQGNAADSEKEPWLYSLFSNSMNLQYPAGSALFNTLANYTYALQFQLLFLYQQCRTNYNQTYGWQWCRYGQSAQPSGSKSNELTSWICKASNCTTFSCRHNSATCPHIQQCGQSGQPSPLQAFLTDNLKGFHVAQQSDPDSPHHLHNHPPGSMCHIPMGFASALTTDANATGWYIYYLLEHFCSGSKTPLRQLCEKITCLTKRTPRTLGDLFGFIWHLNGQLFKTRPTLKDLAKKLVDAIGTPNNSKVPHFLQRMLEVIGKDASSSGSSPTVLSRSLESMAPAIPFLYQLFMMAESDSVPGRLFDLTQHCHKRVGNDIKHISDDQSGRECSTANDLWSLYQPVLPKSGVTDIHAACRGKDCGGYLYPLTHTTGSAFASNYATTYFSWVLYLTDDLEIGLQEMLDAFKNIDCQTPGCQKPCKSHHPGQHGTSADCSCDSVVQCAGVLPLYYEYGFTMLYASTLKNTAKRTCQQFHNQLKAVIEGNPVRSILTAIDSFLYMFRIYFFYNLSTFWIMYVCIVLYIYFLRADLLRLKSHAHFPSSYGIPPISLLGAGKAPALKKFTKLTYFMP
ncbi:extracellular matrix-binding ebh, putative [Babesia caballi]|uniref:Extracellular matrix-binding ebh, putative n=1 Tax=Babesia caballi TaxID=5871 RepID=A0AAV4LRA3_BABCB|nr:extracellular matrix-binding ebh, putative [Babesia caballi]